MAPLTLFIGVLIGLSVISGITFVVFGQVTVRKLRKNTETKEYLGVEFISGWDIINVAQALAIPRSWAHKLKNSPLSSLYADIDLLYKNTSKFDRVLAFIFYWLLMFIGISGMILALLDTIGIFD
ncbi:MAG: hypothetical protein KAT06_07525 [Gammaproteobacteria bacterium]|nr:hypothetical protein [Gammaproteobacteria bacterium]